MKISSHVPRTILYFMDHTVSTHRAVLLTLAFLLVVYGVLLVLTPPSSPVPLLAAVFIGSNMFSRSGVLQNTVQGISRHYQRVSRSFHFVASGDTSPHSDHEFELPESFKLELIGALKALDAYGTNSKNANARRRKLFKLMSWRQQKLCDEVGYSQKLRKIDTHIDKNQAVLNKVVESAKEVYNLSFRDFYLHRDDCQGKLPPNFRVMETLGHFVRDWSAEGARELDPMLSYILRNLDAVVPPEEVEDTCVIMPGSGLGRVSHEVAKHRNYGAVYAVEFSGLMHACHQFVYHKVVLDQTSEPPKTHPLYPYIHTCSNYIHTDSQFREICIPNGVERPQNLHVELDDFRYFSVPDNFKNVVVVSAFFIDTAENLIDYFDVINQLTTPLSRNTVKNGYWINVGPLKYGTAAQVELSADEISRIRKKTGWKDVDVSYSVDSESDKVVGYITDTESLWQGYYGLAQWTSAQVGNQRKV